MLTISVVDDLVALVVIATVYTETLPVVPLLIAVAFFGAVLVARSARFKPGLACAVLGADAWVALLKSGVEPVVIGLAMGLLAYAYPAPRSSLESATERFREFREQPTAELARIVRGELRSATSVNERLQQLFTRGPGCDRAGVRFGERGDRGRWRLLARAFSSPMIAVDGGFWHARSARR